ncbi:hypothetical protein ONE63_000239 [Megalurothrips usitatus]|uniref:Uncharacterized protein n=1 Tax=Megalurothrips usitatus TaxID=439358 RepID=A0AAV7XXV1_9NEOP|nr:hypothetical protein ONE63_000239 [Megalurothrips usitatus]
MSADSQGSHHPKFPITNGSLFTSLDGHIPIVHNYRRRRDMQMGTTYVPVHSNQPVIVHNGGLFRAQGHRGADGADDGVLHSPPLPHQHFPPAAVPGQITADDNKGLTQAASCEQLVRDGARDEDGLLRRRFGSEDLIHLRRNLEGGEGDADNTEPSLDDTGDDEDDDDDDDDDDEEEPIYATLSSGCSVTTAANDDFEFYQHAGGASPQRGSGQSHPHGQSQPQSQPPGQNQPQGYHKLSKKPRGPNLSTAPPPPPLPAPAAVPQSVLDVACRGIYRPPPPPPPPPPPAPAYKKRQGFHEVDLRDHLTTADLLEFYSSVPVAAAEAKEAEDAARSQADHHAPLRKTASGRTLDSDDDGRGIYSYHDVIRGCQLDDLDTHGKPPGASQAGRRPGHPPPSAVQRHHQHPGHRDRHRDGHRHHHLRPQQPPHQSHAPQHGPGGRRPRQQNGHLPGLPAGQPLGHLQGGHPPGHAPGHPPGHPQGHSPGHPSGSPMGHPSGQHRPPPPLHPHVSTALCVFRWFRQTPSLEGGRPKSTRDD